jgi:hypothetical protein
MPAYRTKAEKMKKNRWEYLIVEGPNRIGEGLVYTANGKVTEMKLLSQDVNNDHEIVAELLNGLGRVGWELVLMTGYAFCFKRSVRRGP